MDACATPAGPPRVVAKMGVVEDFCFELAFVSEVEFEVALLLLELVAVAADEFVEELVLPDEGLDAELGAAFGEPSLIRLEADDVEFMVLDDSLSALLLLLLSP